MGPSRPGGAAWPQSLSGHLCNRRVGPSAWSERCLMLTNLQFSGREGGQRPGGGGGEHQDPTMAGGTRTLNMRA